MALDGGQDKRILLKLVQTNLVPRLKRNRGLKVSFSQLLSKNGVFSAIMS